jgi:hypothetical protein
MKRKWTTAGAAAVALSMLFGGSVFAFSDIQNDANRAEILALRDAGIVSGIGHDLFAPKGKMSMAQGVAMLVKGFGLNIDNMKFIKEPKASDYFTNVPDDAWYADEFIIAYLNGLPIPKDVDPNQALTKEQYADLLFKAMSTKGEFYFVELWAQLKDEEEVNKEYMTSIQRLVIAKIATLDDGYFHPKQEITRGEAASMLHKAIRFAEKHAAKPELPDKQGVTLDVYKVNEEVNKVVVNWGEKPNPGYSVAITGIQFTDEGEALIYYELREPDPDKMYPQVITEAKAETYVASHYKPVLAGPDNGPMKGGSVEPVEPSEPVQAQDTPISSSAANPGSE